MQNTTVAIFGGGIIGAFLFSDLTRKGVKTTLIEIGEDVSLGSTKANSGLIHAGYDCKEGTLKAKFNVLGNKMYPKIAKRLGEDILECGSLVVGDKDSYEKLNSLLTRGLHNGVKNMKILERKDLLKLEPNLSSNIEYGLYAKDAKVISPYHFCIALCEEGVLNGGKIELNYHTTSILKDESGYLISNGKEQILCQYIINASGVGVNEIGKLLNEDNIPLSFTKGEYMLLDSNEKGLVNRQIFPLPTEKGKGILAGRTLHGNIFFGPTAIDTETYDTTFSYTSTNLIKQEVSKMIDNINWRKVIKEYCGVRVKTGDDFTIKFSEKNKNYVVLAGIASPGLSCAPALSQFIIDYLQKNNNLKTHSIIAKKRKPYTNILKLSDKELENLISKNPDYGEIICSCEKVTKGEILEVLNSPFPPQTTDGIKRRLRTTMGRCQGSFCYPKLLNLIHTHYKKPYEEIKMRGNESLVINNIKEGGIYEK